LHNIEDDTAEAHDLLDGKSLGDLDDPMVKKLIELVGMWWAEAGR
jgi:arylsulfatase